jgi:threonine/homoserine/homoserine lactone efflux protein
VRSATLFTAVKLVGGGYLIFVGLTRLLRRTPPAAAGEPADRPRITGRHAYRQGIVVNVLNPKTALFFLAFLPQFVDPARGSVLAQTLFLGLTFMAIGLVSDSCYALASGTIAGAVRRRTRLSMGTRLTGLVYIALGATAALTRRSVPAHTT